MILQVETKIFEKLKQKPETKIFLVFSFVQLSGFDTTLFWVWLNVTLSYSFMLLNENSKVCGWYRLFSTSRLQAHQLVCAQT